MNGLGLPWEELEQTIKVRRWRGNDANPSSILQIEVNHKVLVAFYTLK